jgi:TonB-dependent SusC/RagA subfamily outer membrane receptor
MKKITVRYVKILIVLLACFLFICGGRIFISPVDPVSEIPEKLNAWYQKYPQQKVYMHLDKPAYIVGDHIWFKIYFLDSRTHLPSSYSNTLIVELINSFGKTSQQRLIKLEDGFAHGDLQLFDTIPPGQYEIRAYTNWMRNFGDDFFFRKQINIWNPELAAELYRDDKLANKKLKKKSLRKSQKIDFQFFPEGGNLIAGLENNVAFKAINELGLGIEVEGEIVNKKGSQAATFKSAHLGMGSFKFTPEPDNKYFAILMNESGKKEKFPLTELLLSGYNLMINPTGREIEVTVQSTVSESEVTLLAQTRGTVYYQETFNLQRGAQKITIPTDSFPTGIAQVTLFNVRAEPQCERLVFIRKDDNLNVAVSTENDSYGTRKKIAVGVRITDPEGEPVRGNFSLAVSNRELPDLSGDFHSGIVSYLLLTSDLKGRIENPEYYFERNTPETRQALDYLMMTQGWRRFRWENVTNNLPLQIDYPVERKLVIKGRITREIFDLPLKNIPVTLTVQSGFNDVFHSRTNDKGKFEFSLPDYEDTLNIEITARRNSGRKNLVIYVDESELPETSTIYSSYTQTMEITGTNVFRPIEKPMGDTNQAKLEGLYHEPDYVIYVDEQLATYNNVFDIIKGRVPGVMVTGENIVIRGISSIYGGTEPLYLIDNIPVDAGAIATLNPHDVERIEFLKGPSSAIYGSRGANGVISIYTRRGFFIKKGVLNFQMLGYYRPREFYSPRYGTQFDHLYPDDRSTLYWAPVLETDSLGMAEVEFYSSDTKGDFKIVLEGISEGGIPAEGQANFEIID